MNFVRTVFQAVIPGLANVVGPDPNYRRIIPEYDPEEKIPQDVKIGTFYYRDATREELDMMASHDPIKVLFEEKIHTRLKLDYIKHLLMKNRIDVLVCIEKFLLELMQTEEFTGVEKIKIVDRFLSSTNGMMKYKTVEWVHFTGIELFWTLFKIPAMPVVERTQCLNFLLRSDIQQYRKEEAIDEITRMAIAGQNNLPVATVANLVDFLIHSGIPHAVLTGQNIMNVLRAREQKEMEQWEQRNAQDRARWRLNRPGPYGDSQNVHDSDINNSIKMAILELCKDIHRRDEDKHEILTENPVDVIDMAKDTLKNHGHTSREIFSSLDRIAIDHAIFTTAKLRLRDIFQRVWNRIMNYIPGQEEQKDAIQRLAVELVDMNGTCSTGHMSRIVNVLTGLNTTKGILTTVKISYNTQIRSNISARINTRIKQDESGDILTSMIETTPEGRQLYRDFAQKIKEEIFQELEKEFQTVYSTDFTKENFELIFNKEYASFQV